MVNYLLVKFLLFINSKGNVNFVKRVKFLRFGLQGNKFTTFFDPSLTSSAYTKWSLRKKCKTRNQKFSTENFQLWKPAHGWWKRGEGPGRCSAWELFVFFLSQWWLSWGRGWKNNKPRIYNMRAFFISACPPNSPLSGSARAWHVKE